MTATVAALFADAAAEAAQAPFLLMPRSATKAYAPDGVQLTYADIAGRAATLRDGYANAGYGHGHRIALLLENRAEFFHHWLALNALGASVVPVNPYYRKAELQYLLDHSGAALAIALPEHRMALQAAARASPGAIPVIDAGSTSLPSARTPPPMDGAPDGGTECALLYTSGTTGRPKGCILSNDYFRHMGAWYLDQGGLCGVTPGQERLLTPLPLFHMNALACSVMAMVMSRGCLVLLDRFHPRSWWADVASTGATIVHYLGVMPAILLGLPESPEDHRHQVRFGFGANVDPAHHAAFEERFGFPLIEAWAMTETGAGACIAANAEPRHLGTRCIGRPRSCEVRVIDDAGDEVSGDAPGALLVRHSADEPRRGFFTGYHKDVAATAAAWDGGWFHTCDRVRRGPDGSLHFVDRSKNIIRRSGENIAALEVETVLLQHDAVAQVAVVPQQDAQRGEEVLAVIVPGPGVAADHATATRIADWCLDQLAYYKAPGYILFTASLPTTATQKVQKTRLQSLVAAQRSATHDLRHRKRPPARETQPQPAAPPAARPIAGYEGIAVAVPVTIPYARTSIHETPWWLGRALAELIAAAGIDKRDIDGLAVASYTLAPDNAVALTQQLGLELRWLEDLPMGGASAVIAMRRAARAVQAGDADVVACVAGDVLGGGQFRSLVEGFSGFSRDAVLPYGATGPNGPFALITRHYMEFHGASREDFGHVAVAQRENAAANPQALLRRPLDMADYLAARPIVEPLHLYDCVMPCCGAEAFLVMSEEQARHRRLPFARIAAAMERHNAFSDAAIQIAGGWELDRDTLYAAAEREPRDMAFLQAYDDYPVIVMLQLEGLGFCPPGGAPRFVRETPLTVSGGGLPLNTGGGQLSGGQAGAAGGFLGLVEGLRQIVGQAGERQLANASVGLVSGYGTVSFDRGLSCAAAILTRGAAT